MIVLRVLAVPLLLLVAYFNFIVSPALCIVLFFARPQPRLAIAIVALISVLWAIFIAYGKGDWAPDNVLFFSTFSIPASATLLYFAFWPIMKNPRTFAAPTTTPTR